MPWENWRVKEMRAEWAKTRKKLDRRIAELEAERDRWKRLAESRPSTAHVTELEAEIESE